MKKLVKGFASVILASMIFVVGCKPTTSTSEPSTGGSEPTGQSKITVTVKGDERIDLQQTIKKPYDTAWSDIKAEIEGNIKPTTAWKDDWNNGDYGLYEWRLGDENGEKISDDYHFIDNTTIYAVSNYKKWKIENDGSGNKVLSGVEGSEPRGKIIIPEGVKSIGAWAFRGCRKLASITIPDGVTSIKTGAFANCWSLASITLPKGLTLIKDRAFESCSDLAEITIPDGVTSIEWFAFSNCSSLVSINIPNSVKLIGKSAFFCCSKLERITIPYRVTLIQDSAFEGCSKLTSITIPDGVTSIGKGAFRGCSSLGTVHFDNKKGWAVYSDLECTKKVTDIAESDLTDTNAKTLLTDTHKDMYWKKN